jgi:hypothetical protein
LMPSYKHIDKSRSTIFLVDTAAAGAQYLRAVLG